MRICLVVHGFPPHERTGVENYTRALAEAFARRGDQVEVFAPRRRPELPHLSVRREPRDGWGLNWISLNAAPETPAEALDPPGVARRFGELLDPRGHHELLRIAPRDVIVLALHGARSRGVLGAIRHGGRTFHLVDAPGSYFTVNAQGALALAARRKLRRILAGVPGAASAMRALGIRLDPPFPTVKDSVRAAELAVAGHVGAGLAPALLPEHA